jgi:hypothetical protein
VTSRSFLDARASAIAARSAGISLNEEFRLPSFGPCSNAAIPAAEEETRGGSPQVSEQKGKEKGKRGPARSAGSKRDVADATGISTREQHWLGSRR